MLNSLGDYLHTREADLGHSLSASCLVEVKALRKEKPKVKIALLQKRNLLYLDDYEIQPSAQIDEKLLQALDIELAQLGYCLSQGLRQTLAKLKLEDLTHLKNWLLKWLSFSLGANQKHEPFFRKFPEDIPKDTESLWWKRVICHFVQAKEQPCIFCGTVGSTHVLNPCKHIVCDQCFDGENYSACPICNYQVDTSSPFFKPTEERPLFEEKVTFKLINVGYELDKTVRELFVSFCLRSQAMSESDKIDLVSIVDDYQEEVLSWLPKEIPVKENMALVFGKLFRVCPPEKVLPAARDHLRTATDVLRFIISSSGGDPSLQPQVKMEIVEALVKPPRWWGKIAKLLSAETPAARMQKLCIPVQKRRVRIMRMSRPLRRALLQLLEEMNWQNLMDDMTRHQSWWVWVGEFLHPHEYHKRYPQVAKAFQIIRKKGPKGEKAAPHRSFYSKVEKAVDAKDVSALITLLEKRPGEFARRLDHLLRLAGDDEQVVNEVLEVFTMNVHRFSTAVLATLHNHLPLREELAPFRIYWPKGAVSRGISAKDERSPLPKRAITRCHSAIEQELLHRFSQRESLPVCLIDKNLEQVMAPFNERTASPGAVDLPRGSSMAIDSSKTVRLFLHWCEPEKNGLSTDLDLSVGFYDDKWQYLGVCSYYQLTFTCEDGTPFDGSDGDEEDLWIAKSAGDLLQAPYPDGATEFVDLNCGNAKSLGIRYAVMVINSYSGMPFGELERAFAGLMLRDEPMGKHFDPRTVELKFALRGESGIFMPLVLDIKEGRLHWLDVFSKGKLIMNNVESSNKAIQKICPQQIEYFQRGTRMNMYELLLMHGASRSGQVHLRDSEGITLFSKKEGETAAAFLSRLQQNKDGEAKSFESIDWASIDFAALFRGDIDLPEETKRYVLFPDKLATNISASDLLTTAEET